MKNVPVHILTAEDIAKMGDRWMADRKKHFRALHKRQRSGQVANQEQVAMLKKGVNGWNKWRKANPSEAIHLSGADLRGLDLRGVNLEGANLHQANLSAANFCALTEVGRGVASEIIWADLSGANLSAANLRGVDFDWTNFSWANLGGTIFGDTKLKDVRGLKTCFHHGPSIIDLGTFKVVASSH